MLTLVPLAMIFAKAPLNTMKTTVIVTAIPFAIITWSRCMACSNGCVRIMAMFLHIRLANSPP
jgi:choline-glycine betaine transporter